MAASVAPLLVVQLLFQSKHGFTDLSHVVTAVSLYLDSSVELPLHKACRFQSIRLLNRIEASGTILVRHNSPNTFSLRRLLRKEWLYIQYQFTRSLLEAVELNNLKVAKWLSAKLQSYEITAEVVAKAAGMGSIDVLQFFYDNDNRAFVQQLRMGRTPMAGHSVEWGGLSMASAIANSHTDVVWWLHRHVPDARYDLSAALKAAVVSGQILMAEWLLGRGAAWPPLGPGAYISLDIAAQGRLDILKWLDEHGQVDATLGLVVKAAEHGHLTVVRWLIDRDATRTGVSTHLTDLGGEVSLAIHAAAIHGHVEVAQYLYVRAKTPDNDLQRQLQAVGYQKTTRTLRTYLGRTNAANIISGRTMAKAAADGFLDVVQWLYAISDTAVKYNIFGYTEVPGNPETRTYVMDVAANDAAFRNGDVPMAEWLLLNGATLPPALPGNRYGHYVAANGHLDLLKWMAERGQLVEMVGFVTRAAERGHLEVVRWLIEHYPQTDGRPNSDSSYTLEDAEGGMCIHIAAVNGHLQVAK